MKTFLPPTQQILTEFSFLLSSIFYPDTSFGQFHFNLQIKENRQTVTISKAVNSNESLFYPNTPTNTAEYFHYVSFVCVFLTFKFQQ